MNFFYMHLNVICENIANYCETIDQMANKIALLTLSMSDNNQ